MCNVSIIVLELPCNKFSALIVPLPLVMINSSMTKTVYTGSSLVLTCTVIVRDVNHSVSTSWTRSGKELVSDNYTTVAPITDINSFTYQTSVEIDVVTQEYSSGIYNCIANVEPSPLSAYVLSSMNSDSFTMDVIGNGLTMGINVLVSLLYCSCYF